MAFIILDSKDKVQEDRNIWWEVAELNERRGKIPL